MNTISRRKFIWTGATGIATLTLGPLCRSAAAAGPKAAGTSIRVGCQANGFPLKQGDFPGLIEAMKKMKGLGYKGVECNIHFVQGQFDKTAEARKQMEDTGVIFISAHTSMQTTTAENFSRTVDRIAALGGSCVVMSSGGTGEARFADPDAWPKKADALNDFGRICRYGGLKLAYHNHNPEFANHNAQMNGLANLTDPALVSFLMDAGHAHLGGGDPAAFMAKHSKRIFGCHLKTFKGGQLHQVPLGKGDWGFEDLAAAVHATSWTGWLLDEEGGLASPPNAPPDPDALAPDRAYIKRVFGA